MSYLYLPNDIAIFLINANFTLSDENAVLYDLWKCDRHIDEKYTQDEYLFKKHIGAEIASYMQIDEIDELTLIMRDVDLEFYGCDADCEQDYILQYFKIIRLELIYIAQKKYHRIKLRSLLHQFGYKRRSERLVSHMTDVLHKLSLIPYLRGYVPCDMNLVGIDEMIIIRLR